MPAPSSSGLSASLDTERTGDPEVPPACGSVAGKPPTARQLRDRRRSGRKHEKRARTIDTKRITKGRRLQVLQEAEPLSTHDRPRTRGECCSGPRPCPFVSCKWHLYLDVNPRSGTVKLNFPDLEPDELEESCALDVADRGRQSIEEIGRFLNFTRDRARQIEMIAVEKIRPLVEDFE